MGGWVWPLTLTRTCHGRQEELSKRLGQLKAHVAELKAMDQSASTTELQKRKVRGRRRRWVT